MGMNPLSANLAKWSNTNNSSAKAEKLRGFDHCVGLACTGLSLISLTHLRIRHYSRSCKVVGRDRLTKYLSHP